MSNLPFVCNSGILNEVPGTPNGYLSKDGKWAAVPFGNKFVIICDGQQVHTANTYELAKEYIDKKVKQTPRKRKSTSSLEEHLK